MNSKKQVILDTNIFINGNSQYMIFDKNHQDAFDEINPSLKVLFQGLGDTDVDFILTPTVAVELLFDGDGYDPEGMKKELHEKYKNQIYRCTFAKFDSEHAAFKGDLSSLSHIINFHYSKDLLGLHYVLARVRKDYQIEFGIDIHCDDSVSSQMAIAKKLGVTIPGTFTDSFKLGLFQRVMQYLFLNCCDFKNDHESVVRLGMSMFVFSSIFNVLKSEGGKYPLINYHRRHNALCDFMIFQYGLTRPDSLILTADEALAKRGNLIYNFVNQAGTFIGIKRIAGDS